MNCLFCFLNPYDMWIQLKKTDKSVVVQTSLLHVTPLNYLAEMLSVYWHVVAMPCMPCHWSGHACLCHQQLEYILSCSPCSLVYAHLVNVGSFTRYNVTEHYWKDLGSVTNRGATRSCAQRYRVIKTWQYFSSRWKAVSWYQCITEAEH